MRSANGCFLPNRVWHMIFRVGVKTLWCVALELEILLTLNSPVLAAH
jgi:hypothetical protein